LLAGLLVFIVPGSGPWMSQEAFVNVMGRGMGNNPLPALVGHFALALLYGWIIAGVHFQPIPWHAVFSSVHCSRSLSTA